MSQHGRVVVVGSANMDLVVKVPHLPQTGETVLGGTFLRAPGGKGANQAVAAARLGCEVFFVGRVGTDPFGDELLAGLARDGVRLDYVVRDQEAPTGVALIFVGEDGSNMIAVAPGANDRLSPEDVRRAEATIASAQVLLVQLEVPIGTVEQALALAEVHEVSAILNPAPARPLPPETLRKVAVLTPNEREAEVLSGVRVNDVLAVYDAADALLGKGAQAVVVTLGRDGALLNTGFRVLRVPAFAVEAVDTTAAGDAFAGALAAFLTTSSNLELAVRYANAVAALSVTKPGAQPSLPTKREVERFLRVAQEPA
ncbi:MAG: ribokinase [Chloroflexi bacterium]|nr:ribokinase [Chloroflexota bacterium]